MKVKDIISKVMHCTRPTIQIECDGGIAYEKVLGISTESSIIEKYGNKTVDVLKIQENKLIIKVKG
jgi:hypothetical protein